MHDRVTAKRTVQRAQVRLKREFHLCSMLGCAQTAVRGTLCIDCEASVLGRVDPIAQQFWVQYQIAARRADDVCWVHWPFSIDAPSGRPTITARLEPGAKPKQMHLARYVYFVVHDAWPEMACHRCPSHPHGEDPRCWNPLHIYNGDATTNGADRRGRRWGSALRHETAVS